MPDETSQGSAAAGQPAAEAQQGQNGAGAAATTPEESQPTADQIARWKALDAKFKEQNVDPDQLLPEFTRRSQQLKDVSDEAQQWRSFFQQQRQAQQAQPQDRAEALTREFAESYTDPARQAALMRDLVREEARKIAREEHVSLSARQTAEQQMSSVLAEAERLGVSRAEVDQLQHKLAGRPLAIALAYAKDPQKAEEAILADRKRKEAEAAEKAKYRSILDTGGRNPGLGARSEDDSDSPIDIPESMYFGKPESYWKRTLGERFGRIRLVRHDGTPVRQS